MQYIPTTELELMIDDIKAWDEESYWEECERDKQEYFDEMEYAGW
jgi:hypothetical protein